MAASNDSIETFSSYCSGEDEVVTVAATLLMSRSGHVRSTVTPPYVAPQVPSALHTAMAAFTRQNRRVVRLRVVDMVAALDRPTEIPTMKLSVEEATAKSKASKCVWSVIVHGIHRD